MEYIILNNKIIEKGKEGISFDNRGFNYGDGLFESIIVKDGKIRFIEDHYERLIKGIASFQILLPEFFTLPFLVHQIQLLTEKNKCLPDARIKVIIWRKTGGLFTPASQELDFLISATLYTAPQELVKNKVFFYENIRRSFSPLSSFKTLSASVYVMASLAKKSSGADDMILLDDKGYISECTNSNIFFTKNSKLYTPSLQCGCIEGILRKQIIHICRNDRISLEEGQFSKEELLDSDYVFTCNVAGMAPVRSIGDVAFSVSDPLFEMLQNRLAEI